MYVTLLEKITLQGLELQSKQQPCPPLVSHVTSLAVGAVVGHASVVGSAHCPIVLTIDESHEVMHEKGQLVNA